MQTIKQAWSLNIIPIIVLVISLLSAQHVWAERPKYASELGFQAGLGYYIGDATQHSFNNVREAYGVQYRYKFDQRWALQVKGQGQRIAFPMPDTNAKQHNPLTNIDVLGEFNFFRLGKRQYDRRVKQFTPYIFLGVGMSVYKGVRGDGKPAQVDQMQAAMYFPFGLGVKWKFADHWGLQAAWQQNLYFADNLENVIAYNNPNALNGSNILWNDFTSSLTIGIVFEFGKTDKICRTCY